MSLEKYMNQKQFNLFFVDIIKNQKIPSEDFLSHIIDSPKLSAKRAIEVYQEDYMARLTEALKNTFRGTYSLIGDDDFNLLAKEYIEATPSLSSDLDDYGDEFSEFCSRHGLSNNYNFLSSLAEFEWEFRLLFHKEKSNGLTAEEIQLAIAEEDKLSLVSSCKLLSFNFLISELYALKDASDDNSSAFDYQNPEWLVLYKKNQFIMIKTLSQSQWEFLKYLETPKTMMEWISLAQNNIEASEIQELFEFISASEIVSN
jgi:hypothetical protein